MAHRSSLGCRCQGATVQGLAVKGNAILTSSPATTLHRRAETGRVGHQALVVKLTPQQNPLFCSCPCPKGRLQETHRFSAKHHHIATVARGVAQREADSSGWLSDAGLKIDLSTCKQQGTWRPNMWLALATSHLYHAKLWQSITNRFHTRNLIITHRQVISKYLKI